MKKAVLLLLVSVAAIRAAANDELAGISRFDIVVENLSPEARAAGLSREGLRGIVDSCLQSAGIVAGDTTSSTFLYLKIVVMELKAGLFRSSGYIYRTDLDLRQPALLVNDPLTVGQAVSWHEGCLGSTGHSAEKLRRAINATVEDYATEFAAAYVSAHVPR